jgi:hypothetical protein
VVSSPRDGLSSKKVKKEEKSEREWKKLKQLLRNR